MKPQTVHGFFEDLAEAQQAVQVLLSNGFPPDRISLTTQTDLHTLPNPVLNEEEKSTGRFMFSLFSDTGQPDEEGPESGTLVRVYALSTAEAERACELLENAGASPVSLDRGS